MRRWRSITALAVLAGVAVLVAGFWLLAPRAGRSLEAYLEEARQRSAAGRPLPPPATTFRATVCAARGCALVEAGGMAFLFGAGEGTAESLTELNLLRADIDAVLLPELETEAVAGLPGLAQAVGSAGRTHPLIVSGPPGVVAVVDGANLLGAAGSGVRLMAAPDGEDQGIAGRLVLDTGIVSIRLFASPNGKDRAYRVDFDGKSLVLAGCRASHEAILSAARGTTLAAGILLAGSDKLTFHTGACPDLERVLETGTRARLSAMLILPADARSATAAWEDLLGDRVGDGLRLGVTSARMDLTGPQPRFEK